MSPTLLSGEMRSWTARTAGSRSSPYSARRRSRRYGGGGLEEGGDAGDAHHVHGRADARRVEGGGGEHHVPSVRPAEHADAGGVEVRTGGDPVERGPDVAERVLPLHPVVHGQEGLAVPVGTADVGDEDGHAPLHEQLRDGLERGALLRLRPAVPGDDDGMLPLPGGRT